MTMNLFDQFASPQVLAIPLTIVALIMPVMLIYARPRLIMNRSAAIQTWLMTKFTKQLMAPLNKPGHTWALVLLTVMAYLLVTNLLGLLPHTFTPTTQLSLNMGLATPLWLATVLTGLRNQPTTSLAHLLPTGTPTLLIPILIVIETISLLIRPIAGVRLTANLTAGHLLITLISSTMLIFTTTPTLAITIGALLLMLTTLEIAVAMIQAYVFTLLLSLYLQENS
uniref:ATP synthase subunit a n=1 Tax=Cyrtodactylus tigroides TaxID=1234048 RepID=A0A3G9E9H5_9SAUR|nr:ATP synthase F0 subunit 6 [Cyrtodactylus tigroides]